MRGRKERRRKEGRRKGVSKLRKKRSKRKWAVVVRVNRVREV